MNNPINFVFLHGGGQGSWIWSETITALEQQTHGQFGRVLALDVPGCGVKRDRVTDALTVTEIVAELIYDIESADLTDVTLVGHSQAGTMLPLLIAARPLLFRKVIYVSCLAPGDGQSALNWRHSMPAGDSALLHAPPPGSRERYRQMFCNDMDAEYAEHFLDKLGVDRWPAQTYEMATWQYDHLDKISSAYVVCLKDAVLIPSWQELFAARLKVKRLLSIDAGHQAMNTRPHALAELLRLAASSHDI